MLSHADKLASRRASVLSVFNPLFSRIARLSLFHIPMSEAIALADGLVFGPVLIA